jgi:hypothetical protein
VPENCSSGKQNTHNSCEKEECCEQGCEEGCEQGCEPQNWGQNSTQYEQQAQLTGTEGQNQNATGNMGTEQNQSHHHHHFHRRRLTKRAEKKIKEKLDQYLDQPPAGSDDILTGLAGDAAAAGRPNSGYGSSSLLSPYANVPSHQRQLSYSGSVSSTSPLAPGWSAPSPPPDQYGAPVHRHITYTQQAPYNPQLVPGQYRGYPEPSEPTEPSEYGHP